MHTPKVRAFVDFLSEHLELETAALRAAWWAWPLSFS
jgi:hypothetical protein